MSDPPLYGLCDLARDLGIPESTVRYYRDVFSIHVPSVGLGRKRRYPEQAAKTLKFIADSFAAGYTREAIDAALRNGSLTDSPETNSESPALSVPDVPHSSHYAVAASLEDAREQRELMWQMIRELSRFGDAIERQHYILTELVEHVFHSSERQLPAAGNGDELETVEEADVVLESEIEEEQSPESTENNQPHSRDLDALRQALEAERRLVEKLRQSKLALERRAAAAEAELEDSHEPEAGLLRRLFDRGRNRQANP